MAVELKVPAVGESITEVVIGEWLKPEGARVELNEAVVVIETDKATVEVSAPVAGVISKVLKNAGAAANVGEVIGYVEEAGKAAASPAPQPAVLEAPAPQPATPSAPAPQPAAPAATPQPAAPAATPQPAVPQETRVMPAARRALEENELRSEEVAATGPGGRLLKEDVIRHVEARSPAATAAAAQSPTLPAVTAEVAAPPKPAPAAAPQPASPAPVVPTSAPAPASAHVSDPGGARGVETVPMTPMRKKIAERLVQAQQTAALLTTFNEIDMGAVIALRQEHQESFQKLHGVKLGFMSFFVKAAVDALRRLPQLNAEIRGDSIVYHNYQDIGVAVGGGKGLVVPILRNAELMSFSEIERAIADYGKRAQENRLKLEELQGGTFTISNGGIYGSLLSTPIVNPPQSGILGLHAIQKRPVVVEDQVVVRSMMYVALTYDHRIIDGREAVTFLKRVKECVETPSRMLLEV